MADNVKDAQHEAVQLHGLVQGLNHLLNDGGEAMNAVYPLSDMIEEKVEQLANDLERIEGQGRKGGPA